jgi:Ca2+-binding EF-hand superfamily protein
MRLHDLILAACILAGPTGQVTAGDGDGPKPNDSPKLPPPLLALLKGSPEDFIKRFDRNHDGYLTKNELPPRMAALFDKADTNGDGRLDRSEVAELLARLRQRHGIEGEPKKDPDAERMIAQILERMDTNKDGKISREEARGPLRENFDRIDTNHDGFLDRKELRQAVGYLMANRKSNPQLQGAGKAQAPDFDALDKNADGRLTREELRGTPYLDKFDEMDANHDGKIDPREFAAYFRKQAEKKKAAEEK